MFSGLPFYSWVITRKIFCLKNVFKYLWTFKQQIALHMAFLEHNSLNSDIIFNPICIPCFSESTFFRVQVFQGPSFSGSRLFKVQVFQGEGLGPVSSVTGSRVQVQVLEIYVFLGTSGTLFTRAYLARWRGSRGSGPLPFFDTVQIVPSNFSTNLEETLWKLV